MSHDTFNAAEVQSGGLKEYRVYGPPGTGKTTWMTRQIALAAKKYGGKRILACSFTRTAAAELTARLKGADIRVPAKNVGTIHSLCFHAAGQPELAETRIADWNDSHPYWQLSKKNTARAIEEGETEDSSLDGSADSLLAQYNILRNQLVELPDMPHDVARFAVEWEAWKAELGLYDFTDLLSITGMEMLYAPNNCTVAFVDEAQDLTPLQLAVVRNWARSMSHFILSGDDDQCLYTFSGAKPDSLITDGFPSDHKIVLGQSYRIPRAVHRLAEKWISKCKHREPKEYKPAEHEGLVRTMPHATYKLAEAAVRDAEKQLAAGRSVMFLAACSYMLRQSVIPLLKDRRIPFWNPYRTTQGEWNPINGARRRKVHAFIYPDGPEGTYAKLWSLDQLEDWLSICNSGSWLKRGAKEALKRVRKAERQQDALYNWYCDYFLQPGFDEAHLCAANASTEWLQKQMPAEKLKSWQYTFDVLEKMGEESPRCVVGTIHSVKGGEAECHPAGTPILTTDGYIPIEQLDPGKHRLASFSIRNSKIRRGTRRRSNGQFGYEFSIGSRPYRGVVLSLDYDNGTKHTEITGNHKLLVRYTDDAPQKYITYLMKKGEWWRVGQCKFSHCKQDNFGTFGPTDRMRHEEADAVWILDVHDTLHEALRAESFTAYTFGIPQTVFKAQSKTLSQDVINSIFESIPHLTERAEECLSYFGKDIRYPYAENTFERTRPRSGRDYGLIIRAINFIPGLMRVPVDTGKSEAEWVTPEAVYKNFAGVVYSLNVEPYHFYLSGGIIVHNCVYLFPDLSPQAVRNLHSPGGGDDIVRQFYVGLTRARQELVICGPSTRFFADIG